MILLLKWFKFSWEISTPSIRILPCKSSTIRLIEMQMVLLPEPVLPTIPIFSLGLTVKESLLRTISVLSLYLRSTPWNSIFPYSGHPGVAMLSDSASCGTYVKSMHLWALTISFSICAWRLRRTVRLYWIPIEYVKSKPRRIELTSPWEWIQMKQIKATKTTAATFKRSLKYCMVALLIYWARMVSLMRAICFSTNLSE